MFEPKNERFWAIRAILAGERSQDTFCADLDLEDTMIVEIILQAIEDPSTLQDLLPQQDEGEESE